MKKRNIPVILLLPLLSLSCSLSHKMERSISKVGLSQAGKRPAPDTTCYSVPEKNHLEGQFGSGTYCHHGRT